MSGTGILPNSAIAATNSEAKIRVYFQAYNGHLRESLTDNGTAWSTQKNPLPAPVKPKTYTPLAVASYDGLGQIRLYYLDINHVISELCWDGSSWFPGDLNAKKFTAASYSQLAVVHWDNQFRVYYQQASDNKILELVRSGTDDWTRGATLSAAAPGSRLAAIRSHDSRIRIYFQAADNKDFVTRQVTTKNNWGDITTIEEADVPPHTAYAATTFGADSNIRLYFQDGSNVVKELSGKGDGNDWSGSASLGKFIPLTLLAAVSWGDIKAIRVYGQTEGDKIQEKRWGEGQDWREGAVVPTN